MAHFFSRGTSIRLSFLAAVYATALTGCNGEDPNLRDVPADPDPTGDPLLGDGATDFISHVPGQSYGTDDAAASGGASSGLALESADSGEAQRAITEADIIKKDGNILYALSQFSGLSVVDISDPAHLKLLGNLRFEASPFEMYLEGTTAYVMFNDYGSYEIDEENQQWVWVTTSRMQAIDVSDPKNLTVLGDEAVAGLISDSRKVGDIIYLVTYQNGYCWRCDSVATTRVTSFDASASDSFDQIDQVSFQDDDGGWGRRSVSVTTERAYVSGFNWNDADGSGVIDVVDISDPAGDLVAGASIKIAGQIENRWQMEEEAGVLRVISQPGGWGTTTPPVLETFSVQSASSVTQLASLDMVLPRPEELRSVRFDGDRAYAVTFERTDPLFTFDLTDPAAPQQVGELEIPGWVHHMEPRGDLIYALGFDPEVDGGALHVSLFDVSVLSNPIMTDRVNFGGDWARFAEDQDRIHKAFNILESEGLILVPFSGSNYDSDTCDYSWTSGIQLVDFTGTDLTLRGVAPQLGTAKRSFLHEGNLIGISEHAVQSFDITDRDTPKEVGALETARNVTTVKKVGDDVIRFGNDWWTDRTILDVTTPERAHEAEPVAELNLTDIAGGNDSSCRNFPSGATVYRSGRWGGQVFVRGDYAYVPRYDTVSYQNEGSYGSLQELTIYVVHLKGQEGPEIVRRFSVEPAYNDSSWNNGTGTGTGKTEHFAGLVQTDNALLVGRAEGRFYYAPYQDTQSEPSYSYDVIDITDPDTAGVVSNIEVPSLWARGGWSYGVGGCMIDMGWGWWGYGYYSGYYGYGGSQNALVSGNVVASQHLEPLEDGTGRVRYYLDRMDVSDPENPKMLDSVNIPGQLIGYDHEDRSLLTVDYVYEEWEPETYLYEGQYGDCSRGNESVYYDRESDRCRSYRRRLNSLELTDGLAWRKGMVAIDKKSESPAAGIAVTNSRVFLHDSPYRPDELLPTEITSIAVDGDGYMSLIGVTELEQTRHAWWSQIQARDDRAFLSSNGEIQVVDTASGKAQVHTVETPGWSCSSLEVADGEGYCAQGQYGVTRFELN